MLFRKELFVLLWLLLYNCGCSTHGLFFSCNFTTILPLSSFCYNVVQGNLIGLVLGLHGPRPLTADLLNGSLSRTLWLTDRLMVDRMSSQLSWHLLLLKLLEIWTVDDEEVVNVIVINLPNPWYWVVSDLLRTRTWGWLSSTYRAWSTLIGVFSIRRCIDCCFWLVHVGGCWLRLNIKLIYFGILWDHSLVLGWLWIAFLRSHT